MSRDTVTVDVVEGGKDEKNREKSEFDMSSYEDLPPPPPPTPAFGGDSNGVGKDDYVFVNGFDAVSEDPNELARDGEFNGNSPEREKKGGIDELEVIGVDNGEVDKLLNDYIIKNEGQFESGELESEKGDKSKQENEHEVEGGKLVENGVSNVLEGEVKVEDKDLAIENEENHDSETGVKVEDKELSLDNGGNSNSGCEVGDSKTEGNSVKLDPCKVEDKDLVIHNGVSNVADSELKVEDSDLATGNEDNLNPEIGVIIEDRELVVGDGDNNNSRCEIEVSKTEEGNAVKPGACEFKEDLVIHNGASNVVDSELRVEDGDLPIEKEDNFHMEIGITVEDRASDGDNNNSGSEVEISKTKDGIPIKPDACEFKDRDSTIHNGVSNGLEKEFEFEVRDSGTENDNSLKSEVAVTVQDEKLALDDGDDNNSGCEVEASKTEEGIPVKPDACEFMERDSIIHNGVSNVLEGELDFEGRGSATKNNESLQSQVAVTVKDGELALTDGIGNNSGGVVEDAKTEVADPVEPDACEVKDQELSGEINDSGKSCHSGGNDAEGTVAVSLNSDATAAVETVSDDTDYGKQLGMAEEQNVTVAMNDGLQAVIVEADEQKEPANDLEPQRVEVEVEAGESLPSVVNVSEKQVIEEKDQPQPHEVEAREFEPLVNTDKETPPVGADVSYQSGEGEVIESEQPHCVIKDPQHQEHEVQPQQSVGEAQEVSPLDDEIAEPQQAIDGEIRDPVPTEGEAEVKELDNLALSSEFEGEQNGLQPIDIVEVEIRDQNDIDVTVRSEETLGLQSASAQSDEAEKQSLPESTAQAQAESSSDYAQQDKQQLETNDQNGHANISYKSNSIISGVGLTAKISFGSFDTEDYKATFSSAPKVEVVELPNGDAALLESKRNGAHVTGPNNVEGISADDASTSSKEGSAADALDGPNVSAETVKRPFPYLIRIPRFEDGKLKERINLAQVQVDEQTRKRDSVRIEYQEKKAVFRELKVALEAARSEERAARDLVRAKLKEIDSAQSVINLVKNAMTIEDVDSKIHNMEYKIQHETMPLIVEKQLIREIKQLKNLREQLSANASRQQELQQALDQRDEVEEKLRTLRREMDALRDSLSKAEEAVKAAKKKYDDGSVMLNELNAQFRSSDAIRQDAYSHLHNLRKQLSEKNKYFWSYKNDSKAAHDLSAAGDKDALQRHCVNQVERIMELWNNDDEFRKEYIRNNARSTLRRLGTLDGRSLGPDEKPTSLNAGANDSVKALNKVNSEATPSPLERNIAMEAEKADNKPEKKNPKQKSQNVTTKKDKAAPLMDVLNEAYHRIEIEEEREEHKLTKEEEEMARKAEELRKMEEAAKLREQRQLEEKIKAQEALERKRRIAEKAQARAEFRARKEAEEKEKAREKKAKKKERKMGMTVETTPKPETDLSSHSQALTDTTGEFDPAKTHVTAPTRTQKPTSYSKQVKPKSIPPPLRNRSKRKMRQWMWVAVTVLVVLALFFLGNSNFFRLLNFGPTH